MVAHMDHDQIQRALADLEKRVRALEKLEEKRWRSAFDEAVATRKPDGRYYIVRDCEGNVVANGWCECGRDVCRAPDCPSHKGGS